MAVSGVSLRTPAARTIASSSSPRFSAKPFIGSSVTACRTPDDPKGASTPWPKVDARTRVRRNPLQHRHVETIYTIHQDFVLYKNVRIGWASPSKISVIFQLVARTVRAVYHDAVITPPERAAQAMRGWKT